MITPIKSPTVFVVATFQMATQRVSLALKRAALAMETRQFVTFSAGRRSAALRQGSKAKAARGTRRTSTAPASLCRSI
jgi:hypothetical protein